MGEPSGELYPPRAVATNARMRYTVVMAVARLTIELDQEDDGRWIAELQGLSGALAYGRNREDAIAKVEVLALRILADRLEHGEAVPQVGSVFTVAA